MTDLMSRKDIIAILKKFGLDVTYITLIRYAELGIIDNPTYSGSGVGRGSQAYYPQSTLGAIYAAANLTKSGLRLFEIKNIVKLANILEDKKYRSEKDVIDDAELRKYLVAAGSKVAFYSAIFLHLKNEITENYGIHLLNEGVDFGQMVNDCGLAGVKLPVPYITQSLLVAIANNDQTILSRFK